jgi:tetratricopeptide (TPR) repeat protein
MISSARIAQAVAAGWLLIAAGPAQADTLYAPPSPDDVRARAVEWVAARGIDDQEVLEQIGELWAVEGEDLSSRDVFDRLIETFRLADPETRGFLKACSLIERPLVPPEPAILAEREADEYYAANVRLFYARYLAQRRMYDEALEAFEPLLPEQVVDPAGYFFFKAVCQQQLLLREEGLATLDKLLNDTEKVPVSYSNVATLMQHELEALREDSLDEIAHLMKDVERQLDLARGGPKVQKREEEVVAKLDQLIEKLEQQAGG